MSSIPLKILGLSDSIHKMKIDQNEGEPLIITETEN